MLAVINWENEKNVKLDTIVDLAGDVDSHIYLIEISDIIRRDAVIKCLQDDVPANG